MIWKIYNGTHHAAENGDGEFHFHYTTWRVLLRDDAGEFFPYGQLDAVISENVKAIHPQQVIMLVSKKIHDNFDLLASPDSDFFEKLFDPEPETKTYYAETKLSSSEHIASVARSIPDPEEKRTKR